MNGSQSLHIDHRSNAAKQLRALKKRGWRRKKNTTQISSLRSAWQVDWSMHRRKKEQCERIGLPVQGSQALLSKHILSCHKSLWISMVNNWKTRVKNSQYVQRNGRTISENYPAFTPCLVSDKLTGNRVISFSESAARRQNSNATNAISTEIFWCIKANHSLPFLPPPQCVGTPVSNSSLTPILS